MPEHTKQPHPSRHFDIKAKQRAARWRNITRGFRVIMALILAIFAGLYLAACSIGKKNQTTTETDNKTVEQKKKLDRKEHRKGMPVRDNIVE